MLSAYPGQAPFVIMEVMKDLARFAVVLVRPDSHENIGLAARGMANTGFSDLRVVGLDRLEAAAWRTAVHADAILEKARFYGSLPEAVADLHVIVGSTARVRRDFPLVTLPEAVRRIFEYPPSTRIGLVFGNERTGLTSEEIGRANLRFHIPQAGRQPSYNLGVAVTLALYETALRGDPVPAVRKERPLTHAEQAEAGDRFRAMLDGLGFMYDTNRAFIEDKVRDIFFRMAMTAKDRDILLAMFRKPFIGPRRPGSRNRKGKDPS